MEYISAGSIAVLAFLVSLGSLTVTIWAARISVKALDHAIDVQNKSDRKENERAKADVLRQISDCRATLNQIRIEIGTEKANFTVEHPETQRLMDSYNSSLFGSMYESIENAILELDQNWDKIDQWKTNIPFQELLAARSALYRDYQGYQVTLSCGQYCLNEFKEKLAIAREHEKRGFPK